MGDSFLDSSALVKRSAAETGTHRVECLCGPDADNEIWVSRIAGAEAAADAEGLQTDNPGRHP